MYIFILFVNASVLFSGHIFFVNILNFACIYLTFCCWYSGVAAAVVVVVAAAVFLAVLNIDEEIISK